MDGLISIFEYQEPVARAVVDGVKYDFNKELVEVVLEDFSFQTGEDFDYLVPVPLHYYRENWRGFNQAELIAQVIGSRMTNIKLERLLKRVRNTKQQVTMKTKEERETNIKNAFVVDSRWRRKLKDKKVLLVDDVFTSGADMRECTKMLKKAGVAVVWGLSLAH
jgi:ComF family protein